ncbi:MAG: hypothetical protein GXP09_09670 [Gammaproteobacteria bacterium]|nr:hypothetical protein [Gammaproteobacteria bacterium]
MLISKGFAMAEINDIKPLHPIWPSRPPEDGARKKRRQQDKAKPKPPSTDDKDENGKPHIDEYV